METNDNDETLALKKDALAQKVLNFVGSNLKDIREDNLVSNGVLSNDDIALFGESGISDLKLYIAQGIVEGTLTKAKSPAPSNNPSPAASQDEGGSSSGGGGSGGGIVGEKKTVKVMRNDGSMLKVTCPVGMNLKDILKAAKVPVDEGFEVRVNQESEKDLFNVPTDGDFISATRQIKGN